MMLKILKTLAILMSSFFLFVQNAQAVESKDPIKLTLHDWTGQLITTTSSSARRALQKELENSTQERDKISIQLEAVTDSISYNTISYNMISL